LEASDYTDPVQALQIALRAAKVEAGGEEEAELKTLLYDSRGSISVDGVDKAFLRSYLAAADYLFSDPDRLTKAKDGITFTQLVDAVVTLLERQVRLDASSGASIPEAWSAQTLLDRVLERSGKAPIKPRRASLHVL